MTDPVSAALEQAARAQEMGGGSLPSSLPEGEGQGGSLPDTRSRQVEPPSARLAKLEAKCDRYEALWLRSIQEARGCAGTGFPCKPDDCACDAAQCAALLADQVEASDVH